MHLINFLSNLMIPLVIFLIVGYAMLEKVKVFDAFISGAKEGLKTVVSILPTLVGLFVAIGILRQSGVLDAFSDLITPVVKQLGVPASVVPLFLIKMFSSSAATGLMADIFKNFGADSKEGYTAALFMCCSETIFYTISVYLAATKDEKHGAMSKTRWIIPGALISTLAGTIASLLLVHWLC